VQQYLQFIESARQLRLEVAADYLVMAAWLAYLKSALLLRVPSRKIPRPKNWRYACNLRLQRLHADAGAGARLMARDRSGAMCSSVRPGGLRTEKVHCGRPIVRHHPGLWQVKGPYPASRPPCQPRPVMTLEDAGSERVSA